LGVMISQLGAMAGPHLFTGRVQGSPPPVVLGGQCSGFALLRPHQHFHEVDRAIFGGNMQRASPCPVLDLILTLTLSEPYSNPHPDPHPNSNSSQTQTQTQARSPTLTTLTLTLNYLSPPQCAALGLWRCSFCLLRLGTDVASLLVRRDPCKREGEGER
jgi:hypothetical protein